MICNTAAFGIVRFALIGLISLFLWSCSGFNKITKSTDYNYKLKKANEYYDKGKYEKAQFLYQDVINFFKATEQYEFIFYRFAYCSYYLKDHLSAQMLFKDFIAKFPQSDKIEEMDYMYAFSSFAESPSYTLDQTHTIKSMNLFQIFLTNYPNSSKAPAAIDMINQCKEKLETKDRKAAEQYENAEQYRAAAVSYNYLVQEYSESPRVESYKFLAVKNAYQFASLSIPEKQLERFEVVVKEYEDFLNRFPESKYLASLNNFYQNANKKINTLQHEHLTQNE